MLQSSRFCWLHRCKSWKGRWKIQSRSFRCTPNDVATRETDLQGKKMGGVATGEADLESEKLKILATGETDLKGQEMEKVATGETDLKGQKSEVVATGDTVLEGWKKLEIVATGETDLEAGEEIAGRFVSVEIPSELGALVVVERGKWRTSGHL